MSALTTAFLALFFAPLSFIYGRHVARTLYGKARTAKRSVGALALGRLVVPAIVLAGVVVALEGRPAFLGHVPAPLAGNGGVLLVVWAIHQVGQVALILFFLAVPYVMGTAFGVVAALSGLWRETPGVAPEVAPEVAPKVAIAEVAEE